MTDQTQLLPCPFCGGPAEVVRERFLWTKPEYITRCGLCMAEIGRWSENRDLVIRLWNHRTPLVGAEMAGEG